MIRPTCLAALSLALSLTLSLASCAAHREEAPASGAAQPFTVKIIALNDFHGNLESPGRFGANSAVPAAQRPEVGGADYLAAHVARLKRRNPLNVVVGAGDFIGASPLISASFFDEPAVEVLNRIGLEFNAVGNHEFDKGWEELLRLQTGGCKLAAGRTDPHSCRGAQVGTPVPFEGAGFKWLSANVVSAATGRTLLPAYGIKTFRNVKVAFIGMTLKDTPAIVTPSATAGLSFRDEAQTVSRLIPELRAQGIESIVVLLHQGGAQTGKEGDINGCAGGLAHSPIAAIVGRLDDAVDLVVSGHTHAAYNCRLANAAGRLIPVTSAHSYGRLLTDIDAVIDPSTKDIIAVKASNLLVSHDGTAPDPAVAAIVAGYRKLVEPIAQAVLGSIAAALPNARIDKACNVPAGYLVADAQLAATRASDAGGAVIAFMNGGGIRGAGFPYAHSSNGSGNLTYGQAFSVQPFGNTLVTMTLTAQEIKDVLEEQFAGCRGQSASATRLLLPSAGFKYYWDGAKGCDARISKVTLTRNGRTEELVKAGKVLHPARTYRVTVNSFLAGGGDNYSTFTKGRNPTAGMLDIDAMVAFLSRHKAPRPPYDPAAINEDLGTPRIHRIGGGSACPSGADTNP